MESVSPPPTSRRRWRQYSLRTLLSLMLVVSVACAWLAAKRESKRGERTKVESLRRAGVGLSYDWQNASQKEPYGPAGPFRGPPNRQLTDAGLAHLVGLRKLESIGLERTGITDDGWPN